MNIICPISHQVLSQEECLNCANTKRPAPCGYDYSLLKKVFGTSDRSGIHVTDLLGCLRRTFYSKTDPSPEYVSDMIIRTLGTLTHAILEDDNPVFTSEIPVSHEGITGRVDLYYENGDLIDFKTTRWLDPAKLPYGEHETQVNVYAWMLESTGKKVDRLFIQYLDMSGPTKCRKCKVPLRMSDGVLACPQCGNTPKLAHLGTALYEIEKMSKEDIEAEILPRRDALANAINNDEVPEANPTWLCRYCAHVDRCPEGQEFIRKTS
jgi:CRISPR/Cas system-associated exonuclease Cas4 (RecB family)